MSEEINNPNLYARFLAPCLGLSKTDFKVLMSVVGTAKTIDEIQAELNTSKASVHRSLNKLVALGLVLKTKEQGEKIGRPRNVYYTPDMEKLKEIFSNASETCVSVAKSSVDEVMKILEKAKLENEAKSTTMKSIEVQQQEVTASVAPDAPAVTSSNQ
jgi:predicted transcriptional regulator